MNFISIKKNVLAFLFLLIPLSTFAETIGIFYQKNKSQHDFAAKEIKKVLEADGHIVELLNLSTLSANYSNKKIVLDRFPSRVAINFINSEGGTAPSGLDPDGFGITTTNTNGKSYYVVGDDDSGLMYGGLQLAKSLQNQNTQNSFQSISQKTNPHLNTRGIKFNIPLDARTPSYSDDGTSAWENVEVMWEFDFWKEMIDELANNYYNTITLWSLNPFPSIVKTPGFPEAALDDVFKANTVWEAFQGANNMWNNQVANTMVKVKTMTMDQKIKHWQDVMAYGKSRGIKFYIMTWNLYPVVLKGAPYNLKTDFNDPNTKAYFKNSVKATFETYPDLAGMGVTAGEKLGSPRPSAAVVGKWIFDTYGAAIAEVKQENPNRKIKFIHREHYTRGPQINTQWKNWPGYNTPGEFDFSFKYEVAHMHASTKPQYISSFLKDRLPAGKKTWITVRNDDHYYMRWGDPDYAREYINNFPPKSQLEGAYIGPDGYIWGREFVSKNHTSGKRQSMINKFWYTMKIFGRLMYDPNTPNSYFKNEISKKFPGVATNNLFDAWQSVSKVTPLVNRFHWGPSDHMFYPELCLSDGDGFHDLRDFLNEDKYNPMQSWEDGEKPNLLSIQEFVAGETGKTSPLVVANNLEKFGNDGLKDIASVSGGTNRELKETIVDIKMMANLGKYYAMKIRASVELHRFETFGNQTNKTKGLEYIREASKLWKKYADLFSSQYKGQIFTRMGTGFYDATILQKEVDKDIAIMQNAKPGGQVDPGIFEVNFTTPNNNANLPIGTNLDVNVTTTLNPTSITDVTLYLNNQIIRKESTSPYDWGSTKDTALANLKQGTYAIKAVAKAKDNRTSEKTITITVGTTTSDCSIAPANFRVISATENTITVDFVNVSTATSYELRAWPEGQFSGNINLPKAFVYKSGTTSPITITGLQANTGYDLVIRSLCNPGTSANAKIVGSTSGGNTPSDCSIAPANFRVISATENTITVDFVNVSTATSYELRAWPEGQFSGNINLPKAFAYKGGTTSPITITGLKVNTGYDLVIRSLCNPGTSASAKIVGSTSGGSNTGSCDIPWNSPNQTYTNSKNFSWTSPKIDISCVNTVNISMKIEGKTPANMEPSDFLNIFYKVDGGTEKSISNNTGGFAIKNISSNNINGNSLEIIIRGNNTWQDETYTITDLKVVNSASQKKISTNNVSIKLYPNPFDGNEFYIDFSGQSKSEDTFIKIYDLNGKIFFDHQTSNNSNEKINLPNTLTKGLYLLSIENSKFRRVEKLIVE